jgi:1-acyl-sn-glycerol-3-phosphate acyltransferase
MGRGNPSGATELRTWGPARRPAAGGGQGPVSGQGPVGGGGQRAAGGGGRGSAGGRRQRPLPSGPFVPWRRRLARWVARVVARSLFRLRLEGAEHLPAGAAVIAASHGNWIDPLVLLAALPARLPLWFLGPAAEEMGVGMRNRLIRWSASALPFRPQGDDLRRTLGAAEAVLAEGGVVVVFAEGRIHAREEEILPLTPGAAYLACRSGVPFVPVAILGTTWLGFRRLVRVRVGAPLIPAGTGPGGEGAGLRGPGYWRARVADLTMAAEGRLRELVAGAGEAALPGAVGRWLTELFNDWPGGQRPTPGEPRSGEVAGPQRPRRPPARSA